MRYTFVFILLLSLVQVGKSQFDTLELNLVELRVSPLSEPNSLDSLLDGGTNSVAQLLVDNTSVQFQQYGGKGSIKSLSVRGLTSSHNKVVWNGLQLNSLTLGMFDFGGISSIGNTYLSLNRGTNIENDGDGAVGGSVSFGSNSKFNQGIITESSSSIGSFGDYMLGLKAGVSKKYWLYNLSFSKEGARNDYEYLNRKRIGFPTIKQENAEFESTNVVQEIKYRRKGTVLKSVSWWNGKRVNIPNHLLENSPATAYTADSSFRSVIELKKTIKKIQFVGVAGTDKQWFKYENPRGGVYTYYTTSNNQLGLRFKYNLNGITLNLKSNTQIQSSNNTNYVGDKSRVLSLTTLNSGYSIPSKRTKLSFMVGGQNSFSGNRIQPITAFNYNKKYKVFEFNGGISTHFRQPTFNDLFWFNGGNENLEPEFGWSIEQSGGVKFKSLVDFNLSGYYSIIDNWIMWSNQGGEWSPQNIKQINAKGVEFETKLKKSVKKIKIKLSNSTAYTRTVVTESDIDGDLSIGKQAMHIPLWNSVFNGGLAYLGWKLTYTTRFNGLRYISLDNNEDSALPSYWLNNVAVEKKIKSKKLNVYLNGQIRNLFDQYYEVVGNIPMPGRAYYLTLKLNFKTKDL